ncbi:MAG: hypothetical protein H0V25_02800 [Solirubrobacterales bacterium]|nr:hypothetical protein [Solirubrobacterales bacterium]
MTKKADFNAEEWSTLVEGPPVAGMIVVAAERGGTVRESIQIGKAYNEARQAHMGPELIEELLSSPPEIDQSGYKSVEDLRARGLQALRDAVTLLEQKATPDEVDAYRGFVLGIAERVAHAHKSGSFLGFGGHEVSDSEKAALEEIRDTIGAHAVPDAE